MVKYNIQKSKNIILFQTEVVHFIWHARKCINSGIQFVHKIIIKSLKEDFIII